MLLTQDNTRSTSIENMPRTDFAAVAWTDHPRPIAIALFGDDTHASRIEYAVQATLHRAIPTSVRVVAACNQLELAVIFQAYTILHKSATQPPIAVIQSDVDEDDITFTNANKTYHMHREFSGRRLSSPSIRDDEHCDAQMARGSLSSLTSASFLGFHLPPTLVTKTRNTVNYHRR
jgi:hypothetical protein